MIPLCQVDTVNGLLRRIRGGPQKGGIGGGGTDEEADEEEAIPLAESEDK